jgi:V/A-type H+-transporting ATPase subunit I
MGTPPVLLRNPRPIRSFEPLLGLLPLPRYGSIDPTKFLATFFPPMFGLMLGDIGYGLLLAVGAAMLFLFGRRKPRLRSLAVIAAICAFFTVGFGLVFGELFGDLGHRLGLQPLWRERFSLGGHDLGEAILGYLAIAVGVGVLQIIFGLVLGMINARRAGDRNMLWGNLARIAGILVLFFFVGRLVRLLPPVFSSFGIAALVAFLAIMIWQSIRHPMHGMMLPLEVLSTIGNILSYARIMAIGVASVILALLATTLAGMMGNVVLAAIIVILVHALNLALGIIDPTIQGLRLHYVEFFSKFLLTGGKRFSPLNKLGGAIA